MLLFFRRIEINRWVDRDCGSSTIPDGVFVDLRTEDNTLSFWEFEDESFINDAVLAISTSPKQEIINKKLDVVWIDKQVLVEGGFEIHKDGKGETVVAALAEKHVNVHIHNTYDLKLFRIICNAVRNKKYSQKRKADVSQILKKAQIDGRIIEKTCNPELWKRIEQIELAK